MSIEVAAHKIQTIYRKFRQAGMVSRNEGEQCREILASSLLDEHLLFEHIGITRDDLDHFTRIYTELTIKTRPPLSPFFDSAYYLSQNPDVEAAGWDPFYHFITRGIRERRSPHPLISLNWVFRDLAEALLRDDPVSTLVQCLSENLVDPHPYVDLAFYLRTHPEAGDFPGGALRHFLQHGILQGRTPNEYLNPAWYAQRYPDVPSDPRDALIHFVQRGDQERRVPSPDFDPDWYVHAYPDVLSDKQPPLHHFLAHGRREGRLPRNPADATRRAAPPDLPSPKSTEPPVAPTASGLDRYTRLRARLAHKRELRLHRFVERDIRPVKLDEPTLTLRTIRFRRARRPVLSIVIPCYNEFLSTLECLQSLEAAQVGLQYEVIIVDDASTDDQLPLLNKIPGLRYLRNSVNLGFLRSANRGVMAARGRYILLLNNDAQVTPGAIEALADVLAQHPDVAAVSPQFLYPNGRLQEAGCSLNRDGTAGMTGLFEDPALPVFNHTREIHYGSGAALMIRRSAAPEPLFDESLAPGYCEDADLCLQLRSRSFRIAYEPKAKVVHHLSLTFGKHLQERRLTQVTRNQQVLLEKWQSTLVELTRVRVLAFYLPQFHPIPENDKWWGAGFTEWHNVVRATPSYAGHYQPHVPADLGFYDLRVIDTLTRQAHLAHRYGLSGFCMYYYNFGGRKLLDTPLNSILANPQIPFHFALCWANENWTKHWDGGNREVLLSQSYDQVTLLSVAEDIRRAVRDARYIRVNTKPLFLIYRPLLIPDPAAAILSIRNAVRERGGEDLHIAYVESMETARQGVRPEDIGCDAVVEFPPQGIAVPAEDTPVLHKPAWLGKRYDYEDTILAALDRRDHSFPIYPSVFPAWDNTPRQPLTGTSFDATSPETFQLYLEEQLEAAKSFLVGDERMVFINAWNEWAEGAHLEPDVALGHRWLEAVRNALEKAGCS